MPLQNDERVDWIFDEAEPTQGDGCCTRNEELANCFRLKSKKMINDEVSGSFVFQLIY